MIDGTNWFAQSHSGDLLHLLTCHHGCILTLYNKAQYPLPYIILALDFCGLEIRPTFLTLGCAVLQAVSCQFVMHSWTLKYFST